MTMTTERPDEIRGLAAAPRRRTRERAAKRRPVRPPAKPVAPHPVDDTVSVITSTFTMITIVCVWMLLQLLVLGGVSQSRAQDLLYTEFRGQLAALTAPIGPEVPVGDPVALLRIPELDLEQVVVEGTASGDLLAGPGHRRDTVLPGQVGISIVYGRANTYGGPLGDITELEVGDEIETVTAQGTLGWTVTNVRHEGDPTPQPLADGAARLTLVTAEGPGGLASSISAAQTVYVDAQAAEGFAAPARGAATLPEPETAMASDQGAWPLMALCLAALVALTLGVVAARQRWSAVLVWVIASPVVIALSWVSTDVVMRLLPNLI